MLDLITTPMKGIQSPENPDHTSGSNQAEAPGSNQGRERGSDGVFPEGHSRGIRGGSSVVKKRSRSSQGSGRSKGSSHPRPRFDTCQSRKQKDAQQWSPRRCIRDHSRTRHPVSSGSHHQLSIHDRTDYTHTNPK